MEKESYYYISNSTTRKTFENEVELESYLKKTTLKKEDFSKPIEIKKITTVTETVEFKFKEVQPLSNDRKIDFLNLLIKKLDSNTEFICKENNLMFLNNNIRSNNRNTLSSYLWAEVDKKYPDGKPLNLSDAFKESNTKYILKKYLKQLTLVPFLLESDMFLKISTDYKPCNSLALVIPINENYEAYLCLREGDILYSTQLVYGRNVYLRSKSLLTNKDLEQYDSKSN